VTVAALFVETRRARERAKETQERRLKINKGGLQ
jgi:hypothetical protein